MIALQVRHGILQITAHKFQLRNLQKVEVLSQAVSRSTSRALNSPRLRHMQSNAIQGGAIHSVLTLDALIIALSYLRYYLGLLWTPCWLAYVVR